MKTLSVRAILFWLCLLLLFRNPLHALTTMPSSSSYIDKLALIMVQGRRQLVARSRGKAVFFTPGGKREAGESDQEALCRECKEELTIQLVAPIKPYGVFEAQAFGKPPGMMVRMTCFTANGYIGTLQPSEEVEELHWIQSDFPPDKLTLTGRMILEDLKQKDLID